ncbi:D-tyrosyl-tRNA(Tyr) deacylase [Pseudoxanthomonas jiangsuensis]|uniref:D-aminoacyl-tRNA deacylase n=1 Tax=Pseudoxanthomonas jiangsuensis TaxID=619688 RepID=UPI00139162BE|nr:D-aminoacyl-tRNA deacylase [Pseudoxanthomonas jiangsuensis]KAF1693672.1 D-tyrosyl-tRNA(Tyr) deacylase [Pseudoxanthomonas jiangsuensis]
MLALIQRVSRASVEVDGQVVGEIGPGLLALVGVQPGDGDAQVARISQKLLGYRVFSDDAGRMNRSLDDTGGGLLLVSQFTLAADTDSGMRPGFSTAAPPAEAEPVFNRLLESCRQRHAGRVETGRFGAHMVVSLVNDGPVTFLLRA